jgi:hypothetical protein
MFISSRYEHQFINDPFKQISFRAVFLNRRAVHQLYRALVLFIREFTGPRSDEGWEPLHGPHPVRSPFIACVCATFLYPIDECPNMCDKFRKKCVNISKI